MIFLMKDDETIKKHIDYVGKNRYSLSSAHFLTKEEGQNAEYYLYAEEALQRGLNVYWLSLDTVGNLDNTTQSVKLYDLRTKKAINTKISDLHQFSDLMVVRTIGNITERIGLIQKGMGFLQQHYKGTIANNPNFIIYGSNKRYLVDLQDAKIPVIPTDFYEGREDINKIRKKYDDPHRYIIKPAVGELSKGFYKLSHITEDWWNAKNNDDYGKYGWVVQPLKEEVFNGEYQLIFFGNEFSHAQVKMVGKTDDGTPNQKERRFNTLYKPSQKEVELCMEIKQYVENKLRQKLNFFRCDFLKDKMQNISVLEFEMFNPGFFFHKREREEDVSIAKHFINSVLKNR